MIKRPPHPRSVEAIAHRLRSLEAALEINQTEVCRRTGLALNTYNQWRNAKGRPELDKAIQLCDAFGISLDWLYRGDAGSLPHQIAVKLAEQQVKAAS